MKKGLLICAALYLVAAVAYEARPTEPATEPPAAQPVAAAAIETPREAPAEASDPRAIHEAHADGGYWYWQR